MLALAMREFVKSGQKYYVSSVKTLNGGTISTIFDSSFVPIKQRISTLARTVEKNGVKTITRHRTTYNLEDITKAKETSCGVHYETIKNVYDKAGRKLHINEGEYGKAYMESNGMMRNSKLYSHETKSLSVNSDKVRTINSEYKNGKSVRFFATNEYPRGRWFTSYNDKGVPHSTDLTWLDHLGEFFFRNGL